MCINISSDIVLANLLSYKVEAENDGISFSDIENYCEKIKREFILKGHQKSDSIYFNINRYNLNKDLLVYNNEFRRFQNKYYKYEDFNIELFNSRIPLEISNLLVSVAQTL